MSDDMTLLLALINKYGFPKSQASLADQALTARPFVAALGLKDLADHLARITPECE